MTTNIFITPNLSVLPNANSLLRDVALATSCRSSLALNKTAQICINKNTGGHI